jgi:hypothetical protein
MATEQQILRIHQLINTTGWAIEHGGNPDASPWTYTVGFWRTLRHPEVTIFGLETEMATELLNIIGHQIENGAFFEPGKRYPKLIDSNDGRYLDCVFVNVPASAHDSYFGVCNRIYRGRLRYRVRQMVWPDPENRLPWDKDFDQRLRRWQPIIDSHWAERN